MTADTVTNFRLHELTYKYVDKKNEGQVDFKDRIEDPSGDRVTVDKWLKGTPYESTARQLIKQHKLSVTNFTSSLWVGQNNSSLGELQMKELAGDITLNESGELFALREFPTNPTARELAFRSNVGEELSSTEKFELQAFRAFPDNSRAQELFFKSLTGTTLTTEQITELQEYFAQKTAGNAFNL